MSWASFAAIDVRTVQKILKPFIGFDDWYRYQQNQDEQKCCFEDHAPDLLSVGLSITNATLTGHRLPGLRARQVQHPKPSRMIYLRVGTKKTLYPRRKFGPTARQGWIVAPLDS
jgi:hypothetical protein